MLVVDCLVRPIALDTLGPLDVTNTCCMSPLPTVLTLQDIWVHISTTYCSNKTSHIETSIDDSFGLGTILSIPDVNPDDGHVRFW